MSLYGRVTVRIRVSNDYGSVMVRVRARAKARAVRVNVGRPRERHQPDEGEGEGGHQGPPAEAACLAWRRQEPAQRAWVFRWG